MLEAAAAPLMDAGENAAVTPAGRPETDSAKAALKPFWGVAETTTCAELPWRALSDAVFVAMVNVGVGTATEIASVAV